MTITTKFDIGQEVYFVDPHCAGMVPGKGVVVKLSYWQESKDPHLEYWVKMDTWVEPIKFWEVNLFASLSEFKDSMIQRVEEACKEFGKVEYD